MRSHRIYDATIFNLLRAWRNNYIFDFNSGIISFFANRERWTKEVEVERVRGTVFKSGS